MKYLKWRLRFVDLYVLETLLNSYARSLLIYVGTPMLAAGLWQTKDISRIERKIFKKSAMVPNNISPSIIEN